MAATSGPPGYVPPPMPSGGPGPSVGQGVPDMALNKARPVSLTLTRMQLANRLNGAAKAKRLALMLTTKRQAKP